MKDNGSLIKGMRLHQLRVADDIVLLSQNIKQLQLALKVPKISVQIGSDLLQNNVRKTFVMINKRSSTGRLPLPPISSTFYLWFTSFLRLQCKAKKPTQDWSWMFRVPTIRGYALLSENCDESEEESLRQLYPTGNAIRHRNLVPGVGRLGQAVTTQKTVNPKMVENLLLDNRTNK